MVNHVLGKLQTGSPRHYREEQLLLVKKCCCGRSRTDDRQTGMREGAQSRCLGLAEIKRTGPCITKQTTQG